MIQISNDDARIILDLLQRGTKFYREHAVHTRDQDTGRLMAKTVKKLNKQLSIPRCHRGQKPKQL